MEEPTYYGLIEDLEKYLEYQRDIGVQRLDIEQSVLEALAKEPTQVSVDEVSVELAAIPDDFKTLDALSGYIASCKNCDLCKERTNTVPGEGTSEHPDIMFIGESPGADEDALGRPFVGKAGRLLDKMIEAMGYQRSDVYLTNVVKCRPPSSRKPVREEMDACQSYLLQQIQLVKPKVLVALGGTALEGLIGKPAGIRRMRGTWQEFSGIKLMPTFHPSYLLRDPTKKKDAWLDLKQVLVEVGRPVPSAKAK